MLDKDNNRILKADNEKLIIITFFQIHCFKQINIQYLYKSVYNISYINMSYID